MIESDKGVRYNVALIDGTGEYVDIKDVDAAMRNVHTFRCPCCGHDMIPKMGPNRRHHFAHVNDSPCDPERYLHSLAEEVFFEEYRKCLDSGEPFVVDVFSKITCVNSCQADRNTCKKRFVRRKIDLTTLYTKISPEKRVMIDGRYRRPDLLLESEDGQSQLWVEIWVTHQTDEKKRKDCDILEIRVSSEEDILSFRTHYLKQEYSSDENVRLYSRSICPEPEKYDALFGGMQLSELDSTDALVMPEFIKEHEPAWIDLGLPSGTLWSSEYVGSMSFEKALSLFPGRIPTPQQFEELVSMSKETDAVIPAGFTGRNGRMLEMYEADFWTCQPLNENEAVVFHREFLSRFFKQVRSRIHGNCFLKAGKNLNLCVRLVKTV